MAQAPNVPQDDDPITPLPGLSQTCKAKLRTQRVAVVGGGFAGLAAGLRLSRHGVNVTVYEPHTEKQWGGRVRSNRSFADGRIIELGAELIGSFHTAWLRLAQQYGISMINRMGETEYEREGLNLKLRLDTAKDLTWTEVKNLNDLVEQVFKLISLEASLVPQETCPWQESDPTVRKRLEDRDKQSVADALLRIGVRLKSPLWKMLQLRLVNDEVAPLEEMNYLGLLCKVKGGQSKRFELHDSYPMGYWEELEIFRCADGCQSLADQMVAEIKENGGTVAPGTKVAQIDISDNVQLTIQKVKWTKPDKSPPEFELGPKQKVSETFQYVVLAIPPSVWSDVVIRVDGSQQDLQAYVGGALGNGPAVKFFTGLRKRFWISEQAAPSGGTMALGQIWEGTDNQTQAGAQGTVLSIFAGPVIPGKTKGSSRPPTQSEMQLELRKLYSGYDTPNLIRGKTIYQDWPAEPFIKSGYWTPRPDGEIFRVGPKLNTPFPPPPPSPPSPPSQGRLYFAGEHTYPSFFGYMEGALRSGIRAANMLMSRVCGLTVYPCPPPPSSEPRVASAGEAPQSNSFG